MILRHMASGFVFVVGLILLTGRPAHLEEGKAEGGRAGDEEGLYVESDRITDDVIAEDLATMDRLQTRLAAVNAGGVPIGSYHFSKAQAWIDFARNEYESNDRTGVIEAALRQAYLLIQALEARRTDISMDTPIIVSSRMVREDLWQKAAQMKAHKDFRCAEGTLAEWEVMLVRSGHEMEELGWRHAKPYIQKAEELALLTQQKVDACLQPVVKAPPPPPPPTPAPVVVAIQKMETLANEVHFALDEAAIHPKTAKVLDQIATILNTYPVIKLHLKGTADRRGSEEYNATLSKRRAEAVVAYLTAAGVSGDRMTSEAAGKRDAPDDDATLEDFAKSRQGKFIFYDATHFVQTPQFEDLQIERRRPPPTPAAVPPPVAPPQEVLPSIPPPPLKNEVPQNTILHERGGGD